MVLGMQTKSFVWVVWIQVWNLSKMYGYMFGWYGNQPSCVRICMDICLLSMEIYLDLYGILYETLYELYRK